MPSDNPNLCPDHGQDAQRVCVLGSSYIAAVKRAYTENGVRGYKFSFFGGPGKKFTDMSIVGTSIVGGDYNDGGSLDIRDYDLFVIYGTFPTPLKLLTKLESYRAQKYSEQFVKLILQERISHYASHRLYLQLMKAGASNIFILSKNFYASENVGTSQQADEGAALIRNMIKPAIYIPHPEVITSRGGRPPAQYYNGHRAAGHGNDSSDDDDQEPNSIRQPGPTQRHFNSVGGAIMLSAIAEALNSFCASGLDGGPARCSPRASGDFATTP